MFAVAISPDGSTICCGGWTGFESGEYSSSEGDVIYVLDRSNGRLRSRISGLPNVALHLAYSRNGEYLAATLGKTNGLRVYNARDYREVARDSDYKDSSYEVAFAEDGRLTTACYDGYVRLYDSSFKLIAKSRPLADRAPNSVAFSRDATKIAVGFRDSTRIIVLSVPELSLDYEAAKSKVNNGILSSVSFSADGERLAAAGTLFDGGYRKIRIWKHAGHDEFRDYSAAKNTIMELLPLNDGGFAFCSADPSWGAIDIEGKRQLFRKADLCTFHGFSPHFAVSQNGSRFQFSYPDTETATGFSILEHQFVKDLAGLQAPRTLAPHLNINYWRGLMNPTLNGNPLIDPKEVFRALAIAPDSESFVLGTEWALRLFDRRGFEKWYVPAPAPARAVNIAGNGAVALAAFGDGTIRWFSMSDGHELLAFFPHVDHERWVLWTPSGYYDCSPGAEDLIGWHVNNGKDAAADFFPASKFRATRYRPDIIAKILDAVDESEAVRLANAESGRAKQAKEISKTLPPAVDIFAPADGTSFSTSEIIVKFTARSPSDGPVTSYKPFLDGRPVRTERGIIIETADPNVTELRVPVPPRDCELSIIAENRFGASVPATVRLKWKGKQTDEFVVKPKLYVLSIGVSAYSNKNLTLGFAAKDAKDFATVAQQQKDGLYRDVVAKVLTDSEATRDEILDGLDWITKQTTSKDVAMVFLAGHGVTDPNGIYYFLPVNADTEKLKRTCVAFSEIKTTVESLAGKTLFFVDTCHSGDVLGTRRGVADITQVVNELASAENGAVVFASSTGRQYSLEDAAWNNGAFTKALVEGFSGAADLKATGKITLNMLDVYISERVKELTNGKQTPTTTKPQTIPDFPVALKK
jgi:WD40 repeat protein